MTGRPPKWFYAWALWMGLGACVAVVSLRRTRFPHPPELRDPRPSLSGNGQWLAVELPRPSGGIQDIARYQLSSGKLERVNQGFRGQRVNDSSFHPHLDRSGQQMVFSSLASDWVENDLNSVSDVFLWQQGRVQRLLPPNPEPGRSSSFSPRLSPGGDQVAFLSYGWPGSNKEQGRQVCLWSASGVELLGPLQGPALGPAAFPPEGGPPVWSVLDPRGSSRLVRQGQSLLPQWSASHCQPALAREGGFFVSVTDGHHQVYAFGSPPTLVSQTHSGEAGEDSSFEPCCSASGNTLAFTSYARNLGATDSSHILLWERGRGLDCLSSGLPGPHYHPTISEDGQRVVWMAGSQMYLWEKGRGRRCLLLQP